MAAAPETHVYDANLHSDADLQAFFEGDNLVTATRFFRNRAMYLDLEQVLIPMLMQGPARASRRLRVWSAGCSDGREAYSLAMSTHRALSRNNGSGWDWQVRGSDLSRPQIAKARAGVYLVTNHDQDAVQDYGEYFESAGNKGLQVAERIRAHIQFEVEDIIAYQPGEPVDILVCSLVVLYYEQEYQKEIIRKLISRVRPGGFFHVTPVSKRWLLSENHHRTAGSSGAFFQRSSQVGGQDGGFSRNG